MAEIVAETMDNYLLMGHILTCKVIPKDEVHPELWVGANRKWKVIPRGRISRLQHNKVRPCSVVQCSLLTDPIGKNGGRANEGRVTVTSAARAEEAET